MTKALIIGAGIAGPVAAMALQRAGVEVSVFEAHEPVADDVGTYLTIAVNGLDALRAIDAHHIVTEVGFPTPFNRIMSGAGTTLRTFSIGRPLSDGTVSQTVKRPHLYAALIAEAAQRGIPITYGKRLESAQTTADGRVVANFTDGTTESGDLLVGCDGLRSVVRTLLDPTAPPPRYVDMVNFGGFAPAESITDAERTELGVWHMLYGRRAFFGYVTAPSGGVVWFANVPRAEITKAEKQVTTEQGWRAQLIEAFADDPGPAAALVSVGTLDVAGDNVFDHPSTLVWQNGSMVVIGDAAHAPSSISGQGAGMAIEDAVVLAQCVRDNAGVAEALRSYERIRRARVERMVEQEARGVSNKLPGRIAYGRLPKFIPLRNRTSGPRTVSSEQRLRSALLRVVFRFFVTEETLRWTYDHHIDWASSTRSHETATPQMA